jgi:phospholipase/carboxylesterase
MPVFDHLELPPSAGGAADAVIIVLHGYGSNAERSIEASRWIADVFPNAHVYAPNGTFQHIGIMDPKGIGMETEPSPGRHVWYHRYSEKTRQDGLNETLTMLDAYFDECAAAHGLDRSRVAAIGLSQGAITLMNCIPLMEREIGCSIPHSGYLFSPDSIAQRNTQVPAYKEMIRSKTPSCFIHGMADFTLPWQTSLEAANFYDENGIPVEFHLLAGLKHAQMEERSQVLAAEFIGRYVYARTAVPA